MVGEVSATIAARFGVSRNNQEECVVQPVVGALCADDAKMIGNQYVNQGKCVVQPVAIQGNLIGRDVGGPHGVGASNDGVMYTLTKADVHGVTQPIPIQDGREMEKAQNGIGIGQQGDPAYTLDTTGAQAIAFSCKDHGADASHVGPTLRAMPHAAVAFPIDGRNAMRDADKHDEMNRQGTGVGSASDPSHTVTSACVHAVAHAMTVRRLTPRECERLQGFPDDWTLIPWRRKSAEECPDSPRYKALGNSMAVNCMEWIGERIVRYEAR